MCVNPYVRTIICKCECICECCNPPSPIGVVERLKCIEVKVEDLQRGQDSQNTAIQDLKRGMDSLCQRVDGMETQGKGMLSAS